MEKSCSRHYIVFSQPYLVRLALDFGLANRLLARILKVGVQIFCGPKAHIAWRHAPRAVWRHAPPQNFDELKPLRRDFRDSDSCKRFSIYLLNRCFSLIILLSYPFLNLPCLTLNCIWDRNSSCYEKISRRDL